MLIMAKNDAYQKAERLIDTEFGNDTNEVNLANYKLTAIPTSLLKFGPRLRRLDLSSNQLKELPSWIGELNQLEVLNLSDNALSSLPESLGSITDLHTLNIGSNSFSTLSRIAQATPKTQTALCMGKRHTPTPSLD